MMEIFVQFAACSDDCVVVHVYGTVFKLRYRRIMASSYSTILAITTFNNRGKLAAEPQRSSSYDSNSYSMTEEILSKVH